MNFKRLGITFLAAAMCFSLTGCREKERVRGDAAAPEVAARLQVRDPEVHLGAKNLLILDLSEEATTEGTAAEGESAVTPEETAPEGEETTPAGAETAAPAEAKPVMDLSSIDRSTLPKININDWQYMLVNAENPCGEYKPEVSKFEKEQLDSRIIEPMTEFVKAARDAGVKVYISSGYRDYDTQSRLFKRKIKQGYSEEEAATIVAPPGTSEHQTGLACDITDVYRKTKNKSLENTETYKWMSAHCQEYGFIVRFPDGKEDITGIIYEPWHYRYVGVEAAKFIMENNLCLEEFVSLYQ